MAQHTEGLVYKDHPLRRVGNMIYYGSMADPYIILMQVKETKKEKDLEVATSLRGAPAHRGGSSQPRPGGQAEREGWTLQRHGHLRHLAGAGLGR